MIREKIKYKLVKPLQAHNKWVERVLSFNPAQLYKKIKIDPYKRHNKISIAKAFIKPLGKKCSCGCGVNLKGRQTRWASEDCQKFAVGVVGIINNDTNLIRFFLKKYIKHICCKCKKEEGYVEYKNGLIATDLQVDHIIAVCNGGGGCWLGNYQFLCNVCHLEKTRNDKRILNTSSPLKPSSKF